MTPEEQKRLQACINEIAQILYNNTPKAELTTLEAIEKTVRQQMMEYVSPKIALFLSKKWLVSIKGERVNSKVVWVGFLSPKNKRLGKGVPPYKRLSPVLETCCLLLCANESFQNAQTDIETLTGVKVGHSTQHRRIGNREWSFPDAKQPISEVSIDERISSIGSGAVESAVKQIDRRLKISGAQWKLENVSSMLQLRCAYLNGLLAV